MQCILSCTPDDLSGHVRSHLHENMKRPTSWKNSHCVPAASYTREMWKSHLTPVLHQQPHGPTEWTSHEFTPRHLPLSLMFCLSHVSSQFSFPPVSVSQNCHSPTWMSLMLASLPSWRIQYGEPTTVQDNPSVTPNRIEHRMLTHWIPPLLILWDQDLNCSDTTLKTAVATLIDTKSNFRLNSCGSVCRTNTADVDKWCPFLCNRNVIRVWLKSCWLLSGNNSSPRWCWQVTESQYFVNLNASLPHKTYK